MNPDDQTFLTAYLDGALNPEQRLQVESSLSTDPGLADELRDLAAVRDLVAALPRPPAGVDLSASVLASIARRRAPGRLRRAFEPGGLFATRGGRAAVLLASAAALLVVALATVVSRSLQPPEHPGLVVRRGHEAPPPRVNPAPTPRPEPAPPVLVAVPTPPPDPRTLAPGAEERLRDAQRENVRRLLDSPNLRTVFHVADVQHGKTTRLVSQALSQLPRKYPTFVRLDVAADASLDDTRPGATAVFALVVDDTELQTIRDRLRGEFPFQFEEAAPRPERVTLLADVGEESFLKGTAVADIRVPENAGAALRAENRPPIPFRPRIPELEWLSGLLPPTAANRVEPRTPEPPATNRAAPAPVTPAGDAAKAQPEAPRRPLSVLLVWVTQPPVEPANGR